MTRRQTDNERVQPQPGSWTICPDCLGTGNLRSPGMRFCSRCEGEGLFLAEQRTAHNDNDESGDD